VDSPIGPLELKNLGDVFARIMDNLSLRFPDIASKRAGTVARNDILSFLSAINGDPDRLKQVLRNELLRVEETMVVSISERFSRMSNEERRAIDATMRLILRSPFEILFRADVGKQLASSGKEFERFFLSVKSQSPTMRELRYENLIVEKAIFNKLILKAKDHDYFIWVPSFFAKEGAGTLIQRVALPNEHLMLARLRQLALLSNLDKISSFLQSLTDNLGVLDKSEKVPEELSDFIQKTGEYLILPPVDLDDVFTFQKEESEKMERAQLVEEEKLRVLEQQRKDEQSKKSEQFRQKLRPIVEQQKQTVQLQQRQSGGRDTVFLGKELDFDQLVAAINKRVPEKDLAAQVRQVGDFSLELSNYKNNLAIVGSSGSGRSTTLRRILDGIAARGSRRPMIIIDQKGEHRGIAWKYNWKVFSFATDSQAQEFQVSLFSGETETSASLGADLIQEWFNQGSVNCTDQQKERIASIIRAQSKENLNLNMISNLMISEPELSELGQKLRKNLLSKSTFSRIFSEKGPIRVGQDDQLFDVSGRGLKDPTTREERQLISVILLRDFLDSGMKDSIIVVEDTLDRFKSSSLKSRAIEIVKKLGENGNCVLATSRSSVREFLGSGSIIEIVHRLSGEKIINEELGQFKSDVPTQTLMRIIAFLPRGYVITSSYTDSNGESVRTAAVKVEPLTFSNA